MSPWWSTISASSTAPAGSLCTASFPPAHRERYTAGDAVEVKEVVTDSGADHGGLQPGDLIVELDGQRLLGVADLQAALETDGIGSRIVVTVLRAGLERKLVVVPTELPR